MKKKITNEIETLVNIKVAGADTYISQLNTIYKSIEAIKASKAKSFKLDDSTKKEINSVLDLIKGMNEALPKAMPEEFNKILKQLNQPLKHLTKEINNVFESGISAAAKKSRESIQKEITEFSKQLEVVKKDQAAFRADNKFESGEDIIKLAGLRGNSKIAERIKGLNAIDVPKALEEFIQELQAEIDKHPGNKQKVENNKKRIEQARKIIELIRKQTGAEYVQAFNKKDDEFEKKIRELENKVSKLNQKLLETGNLTKGEQDIQDNLNKIDTSSKGIDQQNRTDENNRKSENMKKVGQAVEEANRKTESLTKSLFLARLAANALRRVYRETISTITELDAAFNGIAIVSQYSTKQVWGLYDSFEGIARRAGLTVKEISQVTLEFFRQGRSLTDSLKLTEAAATAAQIAGISAKESVRYLTSAIQGYKLSASQAMEVSDKFAALAASSATDYDGLATALSKVAAQANAVGVNMDSMMGFIAKALETTQEAPENIGTAFKTIFARMSQIKDFGKTLEDGMSINSVEKALRQANVALRDSNGEIRDLDEVLIDVGKQWKTLSRNTQTYITTALAGTRQQTRLLSIFENFDRTIELVKVSQNSLGATYAQQIVYTESLAFSMNGLKVAWESLVSSITSSNFFIGILNVITDIINGLVTINKTLKGIPSTLIILTGLVFTIGLKAESIINVISRLKNATIFDVLVKKAESLSKISGSLSEGLTSFIGKLVESAKGIKILGTSLLGVVGIIGLVAAGVALLGIAIYKSKNKMEELNESTKKLQASLYKLNQKNDSLEQLLKDFKDLDQKIIKTTEDLEKLKEVREKIKDLSLDDEGNLSYQFFNPMGELNQSEIDRYEKDTIKQYEKSMKEISDIVSKINWLDADSFGPLKETYILYESITELSKKENLSLGESYNLWLKLNEEEKEYYYSLGEIAAKYQEMSENEESAKLIQSGFDSIVNSLDPDEVAKHKGDYFNTYLDNIKERIGKALKEIDFNLSDDFIEDSKIIDTLFSDIGATEEEKPLIIELLRAMKPELISIYELSNELKENFNKSWSTKSVISFENSLKNAGISAERTREIMKNILVDTPEEAINTIGNLNLTSQEFFITLDNLVQEMTGKNPFKNLIDSAQSLSSVEKNITDFFDKLNNGTLTSEDFQNTLNQYPELIGEINRVLEEGGTISEEALNNILEGNKLSIEALQEKALQENLYEQSKLKLEIEGYDALFQLYEADKYKNDDILKAKFKSEQEYQKSLIESAKYGAVAVEQAIKGASVEELKAKYETDIKFNIPKSESSAFEDRIKALKEDAQERLTNLKETEKFIRNLDQNVEKIFGNSKGINKEASEYKSKLLAIYAIEQQLALIESFRKGYEDDRAIELAKVIGDEKEELKIKEINNKYDAMSLRFSQRELDLLIQKIKLNKQNQDSIAKQLSAYKDVVDLTSGRAIINFSQLSKYTGKTRENIDNLIEEFNKLADEIDKSISAARKQQAEIIKMINSLKKRNKEILKEIENLTGKETLEAIKNIEDLILEAIRNREEKKIEILRKELEEERKILDERQKMYEEAFAEIDHQAEVDEKNQERELLAKQIAQLATATDTASNVKRKALEERLEELNKDYNNMMTDYNRDSLFKDEENNLSEREQALEEQELRLEDMSNFYEEMNSIISQGDDAIKNFLKNNLTEYLEATQTNKQLIEIAWQETLDRRKEIAQEVENLQSEYVNNLETIKTMEIEYNSLKDELAELEKIRNEAIAKSQSFLASSTKISMSDIKKALDSATRAANDLANALNNLNDIKIEDKDIRIRTPILDSSIDSMTGAYATGGVTHRTGWHWLDGTSSGPERVLSPTQTKLLDQALMNLNDEITNNNNNISIGTIAITTDQLNNSQDFRTAATSFAEELKNAMMNRGLTINQRR